MSSASYTPTPLPRNPRRPFVAAERRKPGRLHVLLISSGSVASIKVPLIVAELGRVGLRQIRHGDICETDERMRVQDPRVSVQVAATASSLSFYTPDEVLSAARHARAEAQMMAHEGDEEEAEEQEQDTRKGRFGIVDVDVDVWSDQDEWGVSGPFSAWSDGRRLSWLISGRQAWKKVGDPILHIEVGHRRRLRPSLVPDARLATRPRTQLRRWADIVIVAPCSANMLAKIASGICDNLAVRSPTADSLASVPSPSPGSRATPHQTSILRALPPSTPTYLFPAMNTAMYAHPLTAPQLRTATDLLGYTVVGPQRGKSLACGDVGPGAMTEWREIVRLVLEQRGTLVARQVQGEGDGGERGSEAQRSVAVAAAEPTGD